jgi:hypothetical protein
VEILEPFAEITLRIQSDSAVTISLVVPSLVHLIDHLNKIKPHLGYLSTLCSQLKQSIEKRFSGIVHRLFQKEISDQDKFADAIYFVAAVLDPRFKFLWLQQMHYRPAVESKMKQSLLHLVLEHCGTNHSPSGGVSHSGRSVSSPDVPHSRTTQSNSTSILKKQKLFHYEDDHYSSSNSLPNAADELDLYLKDATRVEFSLYWQHSRLEILKNVVRKVFSVQASSAPIERVFSQAGLIMSPRRTKMSDEVFRHLLFLRVNHQMI